jgi:Cu+-exporting ATPase
MLIALEVDGMTCVMCVGKVTRTLAAIHGVDDVRVNLESRRAEVQVARGGAVRAEDLIKALESASYASRVVPASAAR